LRFTENTLYFTSFTISLNLSSTGMSEIFEGSETGFFGFYFLDLEDLETFLE
jgi:hypothetical protein